MDNVAFKTRYGLAVVGKEKIMFNPVVFAIPSYRRATAFANKTLQTLKRNGVDPTLIYCFLSDPKEVDDYKAECVKVDQDYIPNFVESVPTLAGNRNFIVNYFPEGQKIVWCDDDLVKINFRKNEKVLEETTNFLYYVHEAFKVCEEKGSWIWGIYAASNPYFMKDNIGEGLYYIIGSCYGTINRHSDVALVNLEDKEDFERTLKYYDNDGIVLRLNYLTVESAYYKEPGGMQETRTSERIETSARFLAEKYPNYCTYYVRKTTGHAELRLRDKTPESSGSTLESFF
jgi:hypothetical protein